jgi:hypothetical protein
MTADGTAANRAGNLRATLVFAQQDEDCEPARLPTLFRVDQELAAPGGRRYLAGCGGRGECYGLTGRCACSISTVRASGRAVAGTYRPAVISRAAKRGPAAVAAAAAPEAGGRCLRRQTKFPACYARVY